jgi:hypothetical protein
VVQVFCNEIKTISYFSEYELCSITKSFSRGIPNQKN